MFCETKLCGTLQHWNSRAKLFLNEKAIAVQKTMK